MLWSVTYKVGVLTYIVAPHFSGLDSFQLLVKGYGRSSYLSIPAQLAATKLSYPITSLPTIITSHVL